MQTFPAFPRAWEDQLTTRRREGSLGCLELYHGTGFQADCAPDQGCLTARHWDTYSWICSSWFQAVWQEIGQESFYSTEETGESCHVMSCSLFRACLFNLFSFWCFFLSVCLFVLCYLRKTAMLPREGGILFWGDKTADGRAQRRAKSFIKALLRYCLLDTGIAKLAMRPNTAEEEKRMGDFFPPKSDFL